MNATQLPGFALTLFLLPTAFGCAQRSTGASETGAVQRVTGTVTYRQRVALPPNSVVTVTLVDASGTESGMLTVAEQALRPEGEVPIPFVLEVDSAAIDPDHRYALRASIRDAEGRVLWVTPEIVPVVPGSDAREVEVVVHPADAVEESAAAPISYRCDGLSFEARHEAEAVRLSLPDREVVLPHVEAASGARYSDGVVTFWSRGDEALLELGGETYEGCRRGASRDPWEEARLNGVDFRASGNEPGWYLELRRAAGAARIDLVADYGERRALFESSEAVAGTGEARRVWRAESDGQRLELVVEDRPCTDSMSGRPFESTVLVRLGEREYRGCGMWLG